MSYILDALRKADAQRESDPARGIHAQPVRTVFASDDSRGRYRRWFWGASAASVAAVGATAWYLYHDKDAVAIAQTFSAPPQPYASMPVAPAPAASAVNPAMPMQPQATGAPPATAVMPPAPVPPPGMGGPLANPRFGIQQPAAPQTGQPAAPVFPQPSPGAAAPMTAPVTPQVQTGQPPTMPTMPARPAPPPAAPAPPPPPVAGLPADAPKLVVSGGVYSADRGQRMLIVNGQVYKEGADLGSGVQLEEIKPNAAVLRFRGARYTTTY
jgi:general secretion pathway protein B